MNTPATVTVAIPTYNRAETVRRRVREFLAIAETPGVELLVIDNASTDGTLKALELEFSHPKIRILSNPKNIGYAGNFLRLLAEVQTDYVVVMSDEDRISPDALDELRQFCAEHSPRMVSPRAQVRNNEKYRGRTVTREIEPSEFENASFYLSGLTFEVSAVKTYAAIIREIIATNSAANIYPQVLITALCVAAGKSFFLDSLLSVQLEELETHIQEGDGGEYFTVSGRWAQFVGYEEFFDLDFSTLLDEEGHRRLEEMRITRRSQLLHKLNSAAIAEFPGLESHFFRGHRDLGATPTVRRLMRALRR